jgi:hypothetical protein
VSPSAAASSAGQIDHRLAAGRLSRRSAVHRILAIDGTYWSDRVVAQIRQVLDCLAAGIYDKTDIEVAITGATGRLPTPPQLRQVVAALTSSGIKRSRL